MSRIRRAQRALRRTIMWAAKQRQDALVLLGLGLVAYGLGGVASAVFGAQFFAPVAAVVIGAGCIRAIAAGTQERR